MRLFDIFRRESQKKISDQPIRLYVREGKPVALQGWFFSDPAVEGIWGALQGTGLHWIWESTRTGAPVRMSDDETNPEHRPRQCLTGELVSVLQYDLLEKNLHGFRRFVALYGGAPALMKITSDDDLRREVEAFASGGVSALSALVVQLGDVAADVIYFNPNDRTFIDSLLKAFGTPPFDELYRCKYKDMKGEELDTVIGYLSCAEHDH